MSNFQTTQAPPIAAGTTYHHFPTSVTQLRTSATQSLASSIQLLISSRFSRPPPPSLALVNYAVQPRHATLVVAYVLSLSLGADDEAADDPDLPLDLLVRLILVVLVGLLRDLFGLVVVVHVSLDPRGPTADATVARPAVGRHRSGSVTARAAWMS
jgi:hypothetical protein